jgi:hypothetical protein
MEKDISFKPLSEGLGFHPFADGLPYAPVVKQKGQAPIAAALNPTLRPPQAPRPAPAMGAGAVAAGRPVPVRPGQGPSIAPARISVPVATVAGLPSRVTPQIAQTVARVAAPVETGLPTRMGFGYVFRRLFAFGVDALVNTGLCLLALGTVMVRLDLSWDAFSNFKILLMALLFLATFNWAIMTAQEVLLGTTLGKRMFGLVLRGETSSLFLRAFLFIPSLVFCGLGVLWAVFDRRKRCWHDHAVDVQPLELAQL